MLFSCAMPRPAVGAIIFTVGAVMMTESRRFRPPDIDLGGSRIAGGGVGLYFTYRSVCDRCDGFWFQQDQCHTQHQHHQQLPPALGFWCLALTAAFAVDGVSQRSIVRSTACVHVPACMCDDAQFHLRPASSFEVQPTAAFLLSSAIPMQCNQPLSNECLWADRRPCLMAGVPDGRRVFFA